jgi:hypothetical protein
MDNKTAWQILAPIFDLEGQTSNTNASYQWELARQIQATGKSARDLTLGELLELCKKADGVYLSLLEKGEI